MKTPIVDFVRDYVNQNNHRMHMPGHKGKEILGAERFDITEIGGADVLYHSDGIIKASQDNAAQLFGSGKTLYSTEGSSLCIRAMTYLIKLYAAENGKEPIILAARNAHKSFVTAAALNDLEIRWLYPENSSSVISAEITPEYLRLCLENSKKKPAALYLTSPDYLGNTLDIAGLSAVCKDFSVLLAVDNAHGAYLKFLPESCHPLDLGADMCCDSAHKTLPVLTGGAYLHVSKNAPTFICDFAEKAMSLFASTSPSYLILQSLDLANEYISSGYRSRLCDFAIKVDALKKHLKELGFQLFSNEPLKITVAPKSYGYTGIQLSKILSEKGIIAEFADPDFLVIMLTCENGAEGIEVLKKAFEEIVAREPIISFPPKVSKGNRKTSIRQAIFSPCEEVSVDAALGRVSADLAVTCPPAIPIVICGEEIDRNAIAAFKYYGIEKCLVTKK